MLVDKNESVLRTPTEKFNFFNPQKNAVELYNELGQTMIDKNGIGLSAPQIGYPYRVFVIRGQQVLPFFNPMIVDKSAETETLEEGCLTFPGILLKIKRSKVIKVRYADPTGEYKTQVFQDMTARVIQHEIDHLDGVLFGQRVSSLQLEIAIKRAKKLNYNYVKSDLK